MPNAACSAAAPGMGSGVKVATATDLKELAPAPPLLAVLSGPSGVGKDAVLAELKKLSRPWHFAVTATTRPPRPGEQDGVDYIFLDTHTFRQMRESGQFLECAEVYGRWYGVPRSQVQAGFAAGQDVILKIDVQGAATVRQLAPAALFIFLLPGSLAELAQRLGQRQTETAAEAELRLQTARRELAQIGRYDYRVINRDGGLEQAAQDIAAIIAAEKCRVIPRIVDFIPGRESQ